MEAPLDILRGNEAGQPVLPPGLDLAQALPQLRRDQGQSQALVNVRLFPAGLEDCRRPTIPGGSAPGDAPGPGLVRPGRGRRSPWPRASAAPNLSGAARVSLSGTPWGRVVSACPGASIHELRRPGFFPVPPAPGAVGRWRPPGQWRRPLPGGGAPGRPPPAGAVPGTLRHRAARDSARGRRSPRRKSPA